MTTFNNLPLTDQLKALEPGDELHLRGGGWLPFKRYDTEQTGNEGDLVAWFSSAERVVFDSYVIRVVRPGEKREAMEVVKMLRELRFNPMELTNKVYIMLNILADHFEAEARKQEKQP